MITNTAETLSRGMSILTENMGIVEAEGFDYAKWQRKYFGSKIKEEIDADMNSYFSAHPYSGDPKKTI